MTPPESLERRTAQSIGWRVCANLAAVIVLFGRAVILARLLEVTTFGTYALAFAIVKFSSVLASFGFDGALLHRDRETVDESRAASHHFTLTMVFSICWATILFVASTRVGDPQLRIALLVLTATTFGLQLAQTPRMVLVRRVHHRRLALVDLCSAVFSSIAAILLALRGAELWALLATDVAVTVVTLVLLFFWRPVWKLSLAWSRDTVRYFLRFGSRSVLANLLAASLDRIDNLWTGLVLGRQSLGFYSRATTFAGYPRRVVANAVNMVVSGTFAELKGDRTRLSDAFRRVNGLLLWVGLFIIGLLAVTAQELVVVVIGERWLPMLLPFRLLLLFAMLDPIERSLASLFAAVGEPERPVYGRGLRLAVLLIGLQWFGSRYGIAGVASAASIAIVVDVVLLLAWSRRHVDFSILSVAGPPAITCLLGVGAALASTPLVSTDLSRGLLKATAFSLVFALLAGFAWRHQLRQSLNGLNIPDSWPPDDLGPP